MSKLFKLKEWLTVPDTAKHLSVVFGEKVTEADVLRLALDGHLKLSVNFVNHTQGKRGKVVTWEETEWLRAPPINTLASYDYKQDISHDALISKLDELFKSVQILVAEKETKTSEIESLPEVQELKNAIDASPKNEIETIKYANNLAKKETNQIKEMPTKYEALFNEMSLSDKLKEMTYQQSIFMKSLNIDNQRYLNLEDEIVTLNGVWDLSMIGNEMLDVEQEYQNLTDGPEITLHCLDGCFVERHDGFICQLLDSDNHYENDYKIDIPGSRAHIAYVQTKINNEEIEENYSKKLIFKLEKERKNFKKKYRSTKKYSYYPADKLPDDCIFVVRTAALREFEQMIADEDNKSTKSVKESTLKTENLLSTLTAIAIEEYGYNPNDKKSPIPKEISEVLSRQGKSCDPKTIRGWLKEGATLLSSK